MAGRHSPLGYRGIWISGIGSNGNLVQVHVDQLALRPILFRVPTIAAFGNAKGERGAVHVAAFDQNREVFANRRSREFYFEAKAPGNLPRDSAYPLRLGPRRYARRDRRVPALDRRILSERPKAPLRTCSVKPPKSCEGESKTAAIPPGDLERSPGVLSPICALERPSACVHVLGDDEGFGMANCNIAILQGVNQDAALRIHV